MKTKKFSKNIFLFNFKKIIKKIKNILIIKKRANIKFGIDLTSKSLHIGHLFILIFIKKIIHLFKDKLIINIILGDFTTYINNNIKNNCIKFNLKKIKIQIKKILKVNNNIKYFKNSSWLKSESIKKISKIYLNNFLKRKKTKKKSLKITIGNLIYPYFQNCDNKKIKPDIELGGVDQFLNFKYENKNKTTFFLFPLILGIKGNKKMSKSLKKNKINLNENCKKIFWKFMKMDDTNTIKNLFLFSKIIKIKKLKLKLDKNMLYKIILFYNVCKFFLKKKKIFKIIKRFYNKKYLGTKKTIYIKNFKNIVDFLFENISRSKKYIKQLIKQGSVKINNFTVNRFDFLISKNSTIRCGKKKMFFVKIER